MTMTGQSGKTVLVLGATGNQGGASAHQLLARGWPVRALVRDTEKPAARRLGDAGAELVPGDLNDETSVREAMRGVHGVHSVQPLSGDAGAEIRQGMLVADLAAELEVAHLVYSSVGGAERHTGIGHFETKGEIERHIQRLDLPATILRPAFFMENFAHFVRPGDEEQLLSLPLPVDLSLQVIAACDIGYLVAEAFDDPEAHLGTRTEIAGDELTPAQVAGAVERVSGFPTRCVEMPREEALEAFGGEEGLRMFDWFVEAGYEADVPGLRTRHPGLLTVEGFLRVRAS